MGDNAVTSVPKYQAADVLTAANLNITNSGIPVFSGTATRDDAFGGSGEKVLAEGQFAFLEDTNTTQFYDGAAWQSVGVAPGLVLVKSQVIGTTVASVEVTGAFSATYDTYLITISGGITSAEALIGLKLGATTTGYYMAGSVNEFNGGSATGIGGNNTAAFLRAGIGSTNGTCLNVVLQNPFLTNITLMTAQVVNTITTGNAGNFGGHLFNSTSYTAFTLTPASGTMTGGTIRVYGYANS
jgi:hypothetical protein